MKGILLSKVFDLTTYMKQLNSLNKILQLAHTQCYIFSLPWLSQQMTIISVNMFNDFYRGTMFRDWRKLNLRILLDQSQSSDVYHRRNTVPESSPYVHIEESHQNLRTRSIFPYSVNLSDPSQSPRRQWDKPNVHWCLTLTKCWVQISSLTPAILSEVLGGFPQTFQENAGIVPETTLHHFLANPYQFIIQDRPALRICSLWKNDRM